MNTALNQFRNNNRFYNGIFKTPTHFDKLFGDLLEGTGIEFSYGNFPSVNVLENDSAYKMEVIAPGFSKEEIVIQLENDSLTISGEKKTEAGDDEKKFTRREFKSEKFSRSFNLPELVNMEEIKAEFKNGIVEIRLPKIQPTKQGSKQIEIQ